MEDFKDVVRKKLKCGWTLHICKEADPDEPVPTYGVWLENTVGVPSA